MTGSLGKAPTILVIMGVAGAGKSTLGRALADRLSSPFLEADELHLPASVAKMRAGEPLTDADRWPWLIAVADWIKREIEAGRTAVVACSALKRSYRDVLARGRPQVRFVHVAGSQALVTERMGSRRDHYFPLSLIESQFEALEPPCADEAAITIDMTLPIRVQTDDVLASLGG